MSTLPEGFTLDNPTLANPQANSAPPPLPDGFSLDMPVAPSPVNTTMDVAKGVNTGLTKGAMGVLGTPGDLSDLQGNIFEYGVQKALKMFGYHPPGGDQIMARSFNDIAQENRGLSQGTNVLPRSNDIEGALTRATGVALPEAKTLPGQYAETVSKFIPAAFLSGANVPNIVRNAVVPGLTSEAAGQYTKGTSLEPLARTVGALAGPLAFATGAKIVTPNAISQDRSALIDTLQKEGIDLTAGQKTGNMPLRWLENSVGDMPFSGQKSGLIEEGQKQQFTQAALRKIGSDAPLATPAALSDAKDAIGSQFNDLTARNSLKIDDGLKSSLDGIASNYQDSVLPSQQSPMVKNTLRDIYGEAQPNATDAVPATPATRTPVLGPDGQTIRYDTTPAVDGTPANAGDFTGEMAGTRYQDIRSRLSKQANSLVLSDPQTSQALSGIRDALDDAMTNSIAPEDAASWNDARQKWANWKVIEKAATGAGEDAAHGYISPAQLRGATVAQNRGAYAVGNGDFADLARAGEGILKPLPNSGTASRLKAQHFVEKLSEAIGGFAGYHATGSMEGAGLGIAAGATAPALVGRALMSRPVQGYLSNQFLPPIESLSPLQRVLLLHSGIQSMPQPAQSVEKLTQQ